MTEKSKPRQVVELAGLAGSYGLAVIFTSSTFWIAIAVACGIGLAHCCGCTG